MRPKATILVDGAGRTLYLFTADPKNVSTCAADPTCPETWPANTTSGKPIAGTGPADVARDRLTFVGRMPIRLLGDAVLAQRRRDRLNRADRRAAVANRPD